VLRAQHPAGVGRRARWAACWSSSASAQAAAPARNRARPSPSPCSRSI
jgi:hypothetical protein